MDRRSDRVRSPRSWSSTRRRGRTRWSGFGSLSPYKDRAAYRTSVEDSVYVHRDHQGRGIGTADRHASCSTIARLSGFHAVFARINATSEASSPLHASCGFELVGIEREVGRKFNRWLDVVIMQALLV